MKISLAKLRKLIREELANAHAMLGSSDDDLAIGRAVGVAGQNQPLQGKVTGRFAADKGQGSIWTVKTRGGQTLQKRASDLKAIEEPEDGEVEKVAKLAPKSPRYDTLGNDNMPVDSNLPSGKKVHEMIGFAGVGASAAAGIADKVEEEFHEKHYEFIARQIVSKWTDRSPEVSWKAIADNYVRATKASTGKVLDSDELYKQLVAVVEEEDDNEKTAYHQQPSRAGKR